MRAPSGELVCCRQEFSQNGRKEQSEIWCVTATEYYPGVLIKNVNITVTHKPADRWQHSIHTVIKRIADSPYMVGPENGKGPQCILNQDHHLLCGFLPVEDIPVVVPKPKKPRRNGGHKYTKEPMESEELLNDEGVCLRTFTERSTSVPRRNANHL